MDTRALLAACVAALGLAACSGNHDALSAQPHDDGKAGSDGGAGADASGAPDADAAPDADGASADATAEGAGDAQDEPAPQLPTVITILNAIPDAPALRLCFVPVTGGVESPASAVSLPADPAGLAFGARLVVGALGGLDPAMTALHPYAIGGDVPGTAATSCADLLAAAATDAGAGAATVAPLPILPAGSLPAGESFLFVPYGCVGGPTHADNWATSICGQNYAPPAPNATLALVAVSRATKPGALGLEVLHASLATGTIDLHVKPSGALSEFSLVEATSSGALSPKPPTFAHAKADFGPPFGDAKLSVQEDGTSSEMTSRTMTDVLAVSGLADGDVVDGKTFTIVLAGPEPGSTDGTWWSGFRAVLVPNDPPLP